MKRWNLNLDTYLQNNNNACNVSVFSDEYLMNNACCGVCEFLVWIDYCGLYNKYVGEMDEPCTAFIPCEEYCRGQLPGRVVK